MNENPRWKRDGSERGSASTKFMIAVLLLGLIGHAGYNYIPVAFDGQSLQEEMGTAVIRGMSATGRNKPADVVKRRLDSALRNSKVPSNAFVEIKKVGEIVQARVRYTKKIDILPFGLYQYDYVFDHTARPTGF